MRVRRSILVAILFAALASPSLRADYHLMRLSEVMTQAGGDPRIQFIEFEMTASGQGSLGGHTILFFDAHGVATGELEIPANVTNAQSGDRVLFATQAFSDAADIEPDFIIPEGLLAPFAGRICFEDIDCVAYGDYDGANASYGAPAPRPPVLGVLSLTRGRTALPRDNSTDYSLAAPSPRNNSRQDGTLAAADPPCHLVETFQDLANWDKPDERTGIDLENCGVPARLDIGTIEAAGGKLLFLPGVIDQLGLDNPIALASLSSAAAQSVVEGSDDESYRVTFTVRAQHGIVQAAAFVRQHNDFADGAFDPSLGAGIGMNFTFGCHRDEAPDPCPDGTSNHMHPDVRLACLSEGAVSRGSRDGNFTAMETLELETDYTFVMDVDGDDVSGPLTLQVKAFPASEAEPPAPTTAWQSDLGIEAPSPGELDHVFLLAALRSAGVAPGPALELSQLRICDIPRNQKFVRFLECARKGDGSILLTWDNPTDAETDVPIEVRVDGVLAGETDGDAVDFVIADAPEEDTVISVTNYSGVAVECLSCRNDPPVAVITGPTEVAFEGEPVTVTLDSGESSDPDEDPSGLLRFWEVLEAPQGSEAALNDSTAAQVLLEVDREGEYRIALTLTDNGCPGDLEIHSTTVEHTIVAGAVAQEPRFRRGDCNSSGSVDLSDAVFFLNFLFTGGAVPVCREACNTNGDRSGDLSDAVALLNHLFSGGPAPPPPGTRDCGVPPEPGALGCEAATSGC